MVRNAITLYDTDRRENGMIPMNCPTRGTQDVLGFTCCEAMMFGDYAWNHANRDWLKARLPGLNHTLMGMEDFLNADRLLGKTPGWNFVDQPAHLKCIRSTTPTPKGDVKLDLSFDGGKATGTVVLPKRLYGTFRWNGVDLTLSPDVNHIQFPPRGP